MYQSFSKNLDKHDIYLQGTEVATMWGKDRDEEWNKIYSYPETTKEHVATLHNPVLVSDFPKAVKEITDYANQQVAIALIGKLNKTTEYNWTELSFNQEEYKTLRWPNIDTLLFCQWLNQLDIQNMTVWCEVGSWPGFISKYIMDQAPNLQSRDMFDINPEAEKFFDKNYRTVKYNKARIHIWDARKNMEGKTYDIITCNPPYIPREQSIEDNAYEWLELLIHLIKKRKQLLNPDGKLVVNISSLSLNILYPLFEEEGIKVQTLAHKKVPLKVYNVLKNPQRIKYLKDNHNLEEWMKDGHKYRQTISIVSIDR